MNSIECVLSSSDLLKIHCLFLKTRLPGCPPCTGLFFGLKKGFYKRGEVMRIISIVLLLVIYGTIFAVLFTLAGCGTHARANFHHVIDQDDDTLGQNPHCELEITKPLNPRIDARLLHQSWCFTGWPFNDNEESTVNAIGVGVKLW